MSLMSLFTLLLVLAASPCGGARISTLGDDDDDVHTLDAWNPSGADDHANDGADHIPVSFSASEESGGHQENQGEDVDGEMAAYLDSAGDVEEIDSIQVEEEHSVEEFDQQQEEDSVENDVRPEEVIAMSSTEEGEVTAAKGLLEEGEIDESADEVDASSSDGERERENENEVRPEEVIASNSEGDQEEEATLVEEVLGADEEVRGDGTTTDEDEPKEEQLRPDAAAESASTQDGTTVAAYPRLVKFTFVAVVVGGAGFAAYYVIGSSAQEP